MTKSILLFAYEINALTAKNLLQKRAGFGAKFKKFKALEIVDHVSACWNELESLFVSHDIKTADKILYTISLLDPLHIGKHRNDIVNNSFLMAVISDDSRFGRDAIEGARFYQYFDNSDFEKKQFSIFLDELKWQYASQEVGIFGWVEVPTGSIDKILKQIAVKFPKENDGELHFIEITSDGEIYPNFSSVKTQKFEGKLAGNYSITLSQSDYEKGLARLNAITNTVVSKSVVTSISDKTSNQEKIIGLSEKVNETENSTEESGRKTYTDDFKRQVANAASQEGATLASVGEQYDVSPTLVRNWKNKFSEENIDTSSLATSEKIEYSFSVKDIQKWLQSSETEGIIDTEGDLSVSLESSEETITDNPINLYLSGSHTLVCGSKSEKFEFETEIRTNEANYLKSDYLNAVDKSETFFTLNFQLKCHVSSNPTALPIKVKEGSIDTSKIKFDGIELAELSFVLEDDAYRIEGRIDGENGFVYGLEALTEEPEPEHFPRATKVMDDESSAEIYEYLWEVKEGDTVYLHIASYSQLDGKIELGFDGKVIAEDTVPEADEHEDQALLVDEIDAEDLFPFEDYKTETAEKFVKFVHKLPKKTFEAVSKYITDGYDLIENNGVLEEAKDEAQLIKIGTAEGEPFESPDEYLDCLLQNISDEIEMYALDGPIISGGNGTADVGDANNSDYQNSFDGSVFLITIQRALQIDDFENLSANNGLIQGPSKTLYLAFNSDTEDYYLVIKGQEIFHATAEEFDYEAPKNALETIRHQLESELSLDTDQVDQLIFYLQANVTDEADEIDEASFSHIVAEMGEVNGKDYFEDEKDACNRIWISTAQNLSYETIVINQDEKSLEFDDEILDQKEVVSWSNFKVSDYIAGSEEDGKVEGKSQELKTIFDITNQPIGSAEFKIEVASACAESGINYLEFAKMYNLNADELNAWALDFLGEGLK